MGWQWRRNIENSVPREERERLCSLPSIPSPRATVLANRTRPAQWHSGCPDATVGPWPYSGRR